jgi:hypothetical protein
MTLSFLKCILCTSENNNWKGNMTNAAFVLMNCDLVAVPLRVGATGVITVYCGAQRANDLLTTADAESLAERPASPLHGVAAPIPLSLAI